MRRFILAIYFCFLLVSCDEIQTGGGARYTVEVDGIVVTNNFGGYYCPDDVNVSVVELGSSGQFLKENIIYDVSHGRSKTFTADRDAVLVATFLVRYDKVAEYSETKLNPSKETIIKVTANDAILKELGIL